MSDSTVPMPQPALVEVYNPNTGEKGFSRTGTAYYGSNWRAGEGFFSADQMRAYGDAREAAAKAEAERLRADLALSQEAHAITMRRAVHAEAEIAAKGEGADV